MENIISDHPQDSSNEPKTPLSGSSSETPAQEAASPTGTEPVREPLKQSIDDDEPELSPEEEKYRLEFTGSEYLRTKAPQVFEVAEAVVEDWVKDGRFEGLPVGHPALQLAAQVGLRKAKDVEKKLEEKGVFLLARTGFEYLKAKIKR